MTDPLDAAESRVLLIGMMGAGKSTVGRALAAATGWPYVDNDDLLVAVTGDDAQTILARDGESALRVAEAKALREAVQRPAPLIAGIAAGVVLDPANRALLKGDGLVVYLRASIDTLAARVGRGQNRPWVNGNARAALAALYAGREPLYQDVAGLVVDVDHTTPAAIVRRIRAALGGDPVTPRTGTSDTS